MNKSIRLMTVQELARLHAQIGFPEYQREPTVWSKSAKQRLIDSIVRRFDVASLYFYEHDDGNIDCIDGRQRIAAIMSFLGDNDGDPDNRFEFKVLNEIYKDDAHPFQVLDGFRFAQIQERARDGNEAAQRLLEQVLKYELAVVTLSESGRPDEFNLQFTRLNLGTIINSGEKLNAMVGELREACFASDGIGAHGLLSRTAIPTRRYSREQVAAQILAQVFEFRKTRKFTRTRHFDLQYLFQGVRHSRRRAEAVDQRCPCNARLP